jgi:hypothetical protein
VTLRLRILLSVGVVILAAGVAGLGAYTIFIRGAEVSPRIASPTAAISLGESGTATGQLNLDGSRLAPGFVQQRTTDLRILGELDLRTVTLTTRATASSALETDPVHGLRLAVDAARQPGIRSTRTARGSSNARTSGRRCWPGGQRSAPTCR